MCSRTVLNELKNLQSQKKIPFRLCRRLVQRFCKAYHIILFVVAMLVLLNENRSCRLLVCRGTQVCSSQQPEDGLFRSNRLQMRFADFGESLCDILKKCEHPCLTSWPVDVYKPYRLQPAQQALPRQVSSRKLGEEQKKHE